MKNFNQVIPTLCSYSSTRALLAGTMLVSGVSSAYADGITLEEIVVTAQKRVESLQDVPISVSAVSGEKLSDAGIQNLQDLSIYVPNLKVVEGGLTPQLFIRGIGSGTNQGFEQSVGLYSDGIYMGRSLQSRSSFMDLERVEVLRGPQSILFGQSSIAGAISLVSARPTDDLDAMIRASYAPDHDTIELNAHVAGPLTDTLSARLAVRSLQDDGYITNIENNADNPELDEQAARLMLAWNISDALSATFKKETAEINREGRVAQILDAGDYPLTSADQSIVFEEEFNLRRQSNEDTRMDFDSENYLLNIEYELPNGLGLTSVTGYSEYDYKEKAWDNDNSPMALLALDMYEDFDQFSQELRLTSPGGETIDYIAGIFYQKSEQNYQEDATFGVSEIGLPAILDTLVVRPFSQESETMAAFVQATWNISENFRATLGLRYTDDEKDGSRSQVAYSVLFPGQTMADLGLAPVLAGGFGLADHQLSDEFSKQNWTPSASAQYDITPDVMLYASYSEGYKAGGFDARGVNGATPDDNPLNIAENKLNGDKFQYDQEEAESIELGAKMILLDGAADLNVALFQTEYTDMQVSVFDGSVGFNVFNAADATARGLELDGRWRPTESLLLTAGMAYLDFEWGEYKDAVCPGIGFADIQASGNCDVSGRENMHSPEWTANISATHTLVLFDTLELRTTLDANFKDNHYTSGDLDERSEQAGATVYNARIALASIEEAWEVALIGKNLTDERIQNFGYQLTQSAGAGTDSDANGVPDAGRSADVNLPRTVVIEASYRF